jgi:GntR family transcriptional regulator/MocR family aminotransferase
MPPSRTRRGRILKVALDPAAGTPLYHQVAESLRHDIAEGMLAAGAWLPSTRQLARDLGIARSTVVQAYEQLRAEGYIVGSLGAGTRVSERLPDRHVRSAPLRAQPMPRFEAPASRRAQHLLETPWRALGVRERAPRAFRSSVPAVDVLPLAVWGRLLAKRWSRTSARMLSYGEPFGYLPLRTAIADYLRGARGVRCTPEQVLVTAGSQQALDLAARILLDPGDRAWLEDPGYHGAHGALLAASAEIVPVPVDDQGLDVARGRALAPDARLAFVTPSRQMPLGVTMSVERRHALLAWAAAARAWIIEDDYDSAFRYASRPLPALQGTDPHGCVLYAGTFSKVMFPALRLGYVVVPAPLVDAFTAARHFADYSSSFLEQAVMADFISEGHFERHIRRVRAIYLERQQVLLDAARRELAGRLDVAPADAGVTVIGWLGGAHVDDDIAVAQAAALAGIDTIPLGRFALRHRVPAGLLLGYAGIPADELCEGVTRLASVLSSLDATATRAPRTIGDAMPVGRGTLLSPRAAR